MYSINEIYGLEKSMQIFYCTKNMWEITHKEVALPNWNESSYMSVRLKAVLQ